jgi:hypothetical protein
MKRFPPDFYAMEPVVSTDGLEEMASTVENEPALLSSSFSPDYVAPYAGNKVELSSTLGSAQVAHTCGLIGCSSQSSSHQHSMKEHFLSDSSSLDLLQQQPLPVVQRFGYHSNQNEQNELDSHEADVFLTPPILHPIVSAGMNVVSYQSAEEKSSVVHMTYFGIAPKHSIKLNGTCPFQQASELQTAWSGLDATNALDVATDNDVVVSGIFKIPSCKPSQMQATHVTAQKWKDFAFEMERSLQFRDSDPEGMECSARQVDDFPVPDFDEMVFFLQDVDVEFEDACEYDDPWPL